MSTISSSETIVLSEVAAAKVAELIAQEGADEQLALRVSVRPGGCSGFSYEMFFDSDVAEDDLQATFGSVRVVVDPVSAPPAERGDARLQGRAAGRRVLDQQPQRHPHLRLRQQLQLISPPSWHPSGARVCAMLHRDVDPPGR